MQKKAYALLLLCFCIFSTAAAYSQKTAQDIAEELGPAVVLVVGEVPPDSIGLGTGFFVRADLIATNFHVVEGTDKVYLKLSDDTVLESDTLFAFDEEKDLALIKLPVRQVIEPVTLGNSLDIKQGQDVVVISNPRGILENTVSNGLISAVRELSTYTLFQISAPISLGSSGGPVFNADGEVVAVVVGTIEEGQNLNFAVPVSYLKELLLKLHETKLSELPSRPHEEEVPSNDPVMDGSWVATYADALSSGKLYFNLVQLSDGQVAGTYTSSDGGGGKIEGTLVGKILEFELRQSNVDCPGLYTGKAVTDGKRGLGSYTGYSCYGDHGEGTVTLVRSEEAPLPSQVPVVSVGKSKPCPIPVYIVGIYLNDGTQGVGWLTKNMNKWWEKKGNKKYSTICFVEEEHRADYRLEWSGSYYSVPMYNQQTGTPMGSWGHSEVRTTVYKAGSQVLLSTNSHHGRWRWSKPDKDSFKEAIEFIQKQSAGDPR